MEALGRWAVSNKRGNPVAAMRAIGAFLKILLQLENVFVHGIQEPIHASPENGKTGSRLVATSTANALWPNRAEILVARTQLINTFEEIIDFGRDNRLYQTDSGGPETFEGHSVGRKHMLKFDQLSGTLSMGTAPMSLQG